MNSKKSSFLSVLWLGVLFAVSLFVTSCDNFLKAGEVKNDIMEAIEIANSDPVTIYVEAEEGSGTVTPTQLRLKKKEKFELLFKPSENWRFIRWEVYDRRTDEAVTDAIKFDDETAVETKAKLVKPQDGLVIKAKTVLIPKILSVTPENNSIVPVYTPIVITLNTPVEEPDAASSIFTYSDDSISLTSSYGSIVNYFEEPFLNAEKTVLTIKPKAKLLQSYLMENNISVLDLNVTFSDKIVLTSENSSISLAEDSDASISILYKTAEDTHAPGEQDFFASNKPITLENYKSFTDDKVVFPEDFERYDPQTTTFDTFDVKFFTPTEVYKNTVANVIYIYGKYNDDGCGVNSVIVREVRTHDNQANTDAVISDSPVEPVKYDSNNAVFISNGNVTEFIIAHKVKSKAGAVKITAAVADSFDNIVTKSFYIFKLDEDSFINFEPRNFDCTRVSERFYDNPADNSIFNKADFQAYLKRIVIPASASRSAPGENRSIFSEKVFKIAEYEDEDGDGDRENIYINSSRFSFKCSFIYNNKEYQASDFSFVNDKNDPYRSYWYCDLYTDPVSKTYVASVTGLKIKITVTDDLGNSMTKEYTFPQEACVVVNGANLKIYNGGNTNHYLIVRESHDEWEYIKLQLHDVFSMEDDYDYYVIPVNRSEGEKGDFCFCGVMSTESFTRGPSQSQELDYMVELKQEPVFEYFPEDKNWGVNFVLADNTWLKFDVVYYTIDEPFERIESYSVTPGSKTAKYLIPDYEMSGYQPVKQLYNNNLKVSFYGIKNCSITETALEKTIVTVTDQASKYDVIGPTVSSNQGHMFSRENLYTYKLKAADYDSGLKAINIVNEDETRTLLKGDLVNNVEYSFSAREIENSAGDSGLTRLEVTDNKDNGTRIYVRKTELGNEHHFPRRITTSASGKWQVGILDSVHELYLLQTKTDSDNPGYLKWGPPAKLNNDEINGETGFYDIPDNIFIRLDTFERSLPIGAMGYRYFYTSASVKSSGNYDYIQSLSEKTFLIASDAPTLVQTIKTKKPYYECQNWTIDEWEAYNDAFCVKQMNLTPESPYQFYLIPSNQLEEGDCYVVIAYFPNGKGNTAIGDSSPVYRAEPAKSFMTSVMVAK